MSVDRNQFTIRGCRDITPVLVLFSVGQKDRLACGSAPVPVPVELGVVDRAAATDAFPDNTVTAEGELQEVLPFNFR